MSAVKARAALATARAAILDDERTIHECQARIEAALKQVERLTTYLEVDAELAAQPSPAANDGERHMTGVSGEMVAVAVDAIRSAGQPIRTRDLVDLLKTRGIEVPADSNRAVSDLSNYLGRSGKVRNLGKTTGWALLEWQPTAGAGSSPPADAEDNGDESDEGDGDAPAQPDPIRIAPRTMYDFGLQGGD